MFLKDNGMANIQKTIIPYNKYFIDSGKFLIDFECFTEVKIPQNFTLIDSDTGETLNDFKKNSLEIPYGNHKIYLALIQNVLPKITIKKIMFYFPAKVEGDRYFYGISKQTVLNVLEHVKSIGYLSFKDTNEIYKKIFVKDLDFKVDFRLKLSDVEQVQAWNRHMKERFNGLPVFCSVWDNKDKNIGIQTYERAIATISKPFLKFYDKSTELLSKNNTLFFNSLSAELQSEIQSNFIYRYEFTLKDNTYFKRLGISNRLEEVHEILNDKLAQIGKYFLFTNFQPKPPKKIDTSKLKPVEKILTMHFMEDIESGKNIGEIKDLYIISQDSKKNRYRMSVLFDKIYSHATTGEKSQDAKKTYDRVKKWDKFFGFVNFNIKDFNF